MRINYIDLGLKNGAEIRMFLEDAADLDADLVVHGVEAYPPYYEKCRRTFADDSRVTVHNFAVGSSDGSTSLFISRSPLGHSIYADKNNVGSKRVEVPQLRFSTWWKRLNLPSGLNIIKANIEGAEWDLIQDMNRHGLFSQFVLFLGSSSRGGWWKDMQKIPSLKGHVSRAKAMFAAYDVKYLRYIAGSKHTPAEREVFRAALKKAVEQYESLASVSNGDD